MQQIKLHPIKSDRPRNEIDDMLDKLKKIESPNLSSPSKKDAFIGKLYQKCKEKHPEEYKDPKEYDFNTVMQAIINNEPSNEKYVKLTEG